MDFTTQHICFEEIGASGEHKKPHDPVVESKLGHSYDRARHGCNCWLPHAGSSLDDHPLLA